MIEHEPFGIDDPYKVRATERFPRDPRPGDSVAIGFRTDATVRRAWVVLEGAGDPRNVDAVQLGDGHWRADLGAVASGRYAYAIHASSVGTAAPSDGATAPPQALERAGPYDLEVGTWTAVTALAGVTTRPRAVVAALTTDGAPARLLITAPAPGAARLELLVGGGEEPEPAEDALQLAVHDDGATLVVDAEGVRLTIERATLAVTAARPGVAERAFRGSLRHRWLVDGDCRVHAFEAAFELAPSEKLYGLGERFTGPERRGRVWDVRVYEEYKEQGARTYLPVPLVVSSAGYGVWADVEVPSTFDLRGERALVATVPVPAARSSLPLTVIVGERPYDVTSTFTRLTGPAAVPPPWAFGLWMSANTWNSQARATEVLRRTVEEGVPAGVMVIEAWSDEATFYVFNDAEYEPKAADAPVRASDFRFGGRWPDPKAFVDECHAHGVRVVLWQIPVHKRMDDPPPQHRADGEHMVERGYAIQHADGTPYRNAGWWFPQALVVDFTNPEARRWWFDKRRYLFDDIGVDGMKTDGGEHLWGRDLRSWDGRRGQELVNAYANLYVGAYHQFVQEATGGDGVTFSRAGYTGAQRSPIHWAGDEDSTWSAYRASIQAGLSAGVSGIGMWSWDLGGFSGEVPSPELYLRSTAMATFGPVMQYHSEWCSVAECRDRTPWNVAERHADPSVLATFRRFARLRAALVPYLHEQASAAAALGLPLMRYPALAHPEAHDALSEDPYAYLFGDDLFVAPVVERGAPTRAVLLPPGTWIDLWTGTPAAGLTRQVVPAPLERIPVFVREQSPNRARLLQLAAEA